MIPLFRIVALFGFASLAICSPSQAQAASFDCAKAKKPLEKLICHNDELSKLDDALALTYRDALSRLSPAGQVILRGSQRDWLAFMHRNCEARLDVPDGAPNRSARQCLDAEYRERQEQLNTAAHQIGPYLFSRIDKFFLTPSPPNDRTGSRDGFIFAAISMPRIDAPTNNKTQRWNTEIETWFAHRTNNIPYVESELDLSCPTPSNCTTLSEVDISADFEVEMAQDGFISLSSTTYNYIHGSAHGDGYFESSNLLLAPGRELEAEDLFQSSSNWELFLADAVAKIIDADHPELKITSADVESLMEGPRSWSFSGDALTVYLPLYLMYGRLSGYGEARIPWRGLKSYLRRDLPITLNLE